MKSRYLRKGGIPASDVRDELVLIDIDSGRHRTLRVSERAIWSLLAEPRTLEEVTTALKETFTVAPNACNVQAEAFMQQLMAKQAVQLV
jgi:hypothetical protein